MVAADGYIGRLAQRLQAGLRPRIRFLEISVPVKHLNSVVEKVRHPDASMGVHRHTAGIVEEPLAVMLVRRAPCANLCSFGCEDLDAMVVGIGDINSTVRADCDFGGIIEFTFVVAFPSPSAQQIAV